MERGAHLLASLLSEVKRLAQSGADAEACVDLGAAARFLRIAPREASSTDLPRIEPPALTAPSIERAVLSLVARCEKLTAAATKSGNPWLRPEGLAEQERLVLLEAVSLRHRLECLESLDTVASFPLLLDLCPPGIRTSFESFSASLEQAVDRMDSTFGPTAHSLADALDLALLIPSESLAQELAEWEPGAAWWRLLLRASAIHELASPERYETLPGGARQSLLGSIPLPPPLRGMESWHAALRGEVEDLARSVEDRWETDPLARFLETLSERRMAIEWQLGTPLEPWHTSRVSLEGQLDALAADTQRAQRLMCDAAYERSANENNWCVVREIRDWIAARLGALNVDFSEALGFERARASMLRELTASAADTSLDEPRRQALRKKIDALDSTRLWPPLTRAGRRSVMASALASFGGLIAEARKPHRVVELSRSLLEQIRDVLDKARFAPEPAFADTGRNFPDQRTPAPLWSGEEGELWLAAIQSLVMLEWWRHGQSPLPDRAEIGADPWRSLIVIDEDADVRKWKFQPEGDRLRFTWASGVTLEVVIR